jgi:hypothetical protein
MSVKGVFLKSYLFLSSLQQSSINQVINEIPTCLTVCISFLHFKIHLRYNYSLFQIFSPNVIIYNTQKYAGGKVHSQDHTMKQSFISSLMIAIVL